MNAGLEGDAAFPPANSPGVPGPADRLVICNRDLEIVVLPGKGADIYSIIDRCTGIDVLFKSPWGWQDPSTLAPTGDSQRDWLARYPGGWQQLVPNAGQERVRHGSRRGYHGEAAVVPWHVDARAHNAVRLSTRLTTAPLALTRTLFLDGPTLHVRDTLVNDGYQPLDVMWVQHPSFGAPFVDERTRLDFTATTFIADAEAPGTELAADASYDLRLPAATRSGGVGDRLRRTPAPHSGHSSFGCLTAFPSGWYTLESPGVGFGIRVGWDTAVYPHAWYWRECHATQEYPWFGQAYVIAIEPANIIPGEPSPGCTERGVAPSLSPGAQWTSDLTVTRVPLS